MISWILESKIKTDKKLHFDIGTFMHSYIDIYMQISNLSEYPKFHFKNRLIFTGNVLYICDGFYGNHYHV